MLLLHCWTNSQMEDEVQDRITVDPPPPSIVGSSPAVAVQESLSLHIQTQPSYWSATGIMGWNPHQLVVVVTAEWVWVVQANLLWDVSWLLFTSPLMFRWIHDGALASTFPCRSHTVVGLDGGFGWLSR